MALLILVLIRPEKGTPVDIMFFFNNTALKIIMHSTFKWLYNTVIFMVNKIKSDLIFPKTLFRDARKTNPRRFEMVKNETHLARFESQLSNLHLTSRL